MQTLHTRPDAQLLDGLQALGEETRLAIVRHLAGGERCVCELQAALHSSQPRLSFHLKKLREGGIITQRREGRWVYYRLLPGALAGIREALGAIESAEATVGDHARCVDQ